MIDFSKFKRMLNVEPDDYEEVGEYEDGYYEGNEYDDNEYDEEYDDRGENFFGRFLKPRKRNYQEPEYSDEGYEQEVQSRRDNYRPNQSYERDNVVSINSAQPKENKLSLFTPTSIEESSEIVNTLVSGITVVVNIEGIERTEAQRITDFMCGASHAVRGNLRRISTRILIIAPNGTTITGKVKAELEANGIKLPNVNRRRG